MEESCGKNLVWNIQVCSSWLWEQLLYQYPVITCIGQANKRNGVSLGWNRNGGILAAPGPSAYLVRSRDETAYQCCTFPQNCMVGSTKKGQQKLDKQINACIVNIIRNDANSAETAWFFSAAHLIPGYDGIYQSLLGCLFSQILYCKMTRFFVDMPVGGSNNTPSDPRWHVAKMVAAWSASDSK